MSHMSSLQLFVALRVNFSFIFPHILLKHLNSIHSLCTQSRAACCDRNRLLSTRKFVWVLLGPEIGQPRAKTNPTSCWISALVCAAVRAVRCIPASPSQCTFPVPVSRWISKCNRDSSRGTAAAQVVNVPTSCRWLQLMQGLFSPYCLFLLPLMSIIAEYEAEIEATEEWRQRKPKLQILCFLGLLAKEIQEFVVLGTAVWMYWKTYSCRFDESNFTVVAFNEIWKGREFKATLIFHCTKSNGVCHFISWN